MSATAKSLQTLVARTAALTLRANNNAQASTSLNTFSKAFFSSRPSMQRRQPEQNRPRFQQQNRHSGRENPRLRTHAVSLYHGDYSDDGADAWGDDDDDDDDKEGEYGFPAESENAELSEWAKKEQEAYEKQKQKWIENAKPPVRTSIIDERGRSYGRGGRKTSSARVWIEPGFGNIVVNRKDFIDYFPRASHREHLLEPFVATLTCGKFDVQCHVQGGGLSGQAGAIRHGIARALNHYNPDDYRPPLKRLGLLTRDPRVVERKKVGRKKARKKGQWSRR
mmetsp:Transcript_18158/g.25592  ORF Transcript_18158/g.25592 Transcript_18158/m.25592 type:complete len:280 (-) Transcript_18158:259-1098(-)